MSSTLVAESIGKSFGERKVLTSARLESRPGEVTFVAGRNGTGKSTLLKIAVGFTQPDHGTVRFCGNLLMPTRLSQIARQGLFYLPDRDILSPSYTVRQHLQTVHERFSGRDILQVAAELGISAVLDQRPRQLSGGETRRAELALAFTRAPLCLVADEPLRGIDPKDRQLLLSALRKLADTGCAVVVSGHEIRVLLDACDSVVWVTDGTSYELGTPTQAVAQDRFRREYLTGRWS